MKKGAKYNFKNQCCFAFSVNFQAFDYMKSAFNDVNVDYAPLINSEWKNL